MLSCYELCATNTQQQQQQQRRDKPRFERTEASRSVRAIPNCNGSEEVCVCMIRDHARSQRACDTDKREGERCGRPSKQARARCSREGGVWCVCVPLWRESGGCRSWSLVVVWSRLRASLLFSSLHAPPRIHRRSLSQGYVRVRARDTMDRPLAIDRSTDEYIHLSLLLSLPCWINRSIDPDQTIWIATRAVVSVLHCATLLTTPSMTRARPPRRPVVLRPPSSPPLVPPRRFSLSCSLAFVLS